jgi:hypothetical protein
MLDRECSNSSDHAVGYGRPPKASQFKPGQSGNPKGRPKGSRSIGAILTKTVGKTVAVTENGETRLIPTLEVTIRRLANDAMRGDRGAMKLLIALLDRYAPEASNAQMSRTVVVLPSNGREAPGTVRPGPPYFEDVVSCRKL